MQQMLNTIQPVTNGSWVHDTDCMFIYANYFFLITHSFVFPVEDKKIKSLDQILETRKKVKSEIAQLKEKLQQTREKIAEFKDVVATQNPQQ